MKVAILADIHGNQFALREVIIQIKKHKIDKIVVAGDTVGYYYGIKEVLDSLNQFEAIVVKGNHEGMLEDYCSGLISKNEIQEKYGSSLVRAVAELSESELAFLTLLPHPVSIIFDNTNFLISHGAPWDMHLYLYEDHIDKYWKNFSDYEEEVFILGHTHRQLFFKRDGKMIINPGSVGQSRSNPGYAEWAIFDTSNLEVKFQSTPYEYSKILSDCYKNDPEVSLLTKSFTKIVL